MPAASGRYKSKRFRSLLELSWLKQVENAYDEIQVEPFRIPYRIGSGKSRDYVPDFFIPSTKVLVEVKPESRLGTRMNKAKFAAAMDYCDKHDYQFRVVTEDDLFKRVQFHEVAHDPDIEWSNGTKKRRCFAKILKNAVKPKKKGKKR